MIFFLFEKCYNREEFDFIQHLTKLHDYNLKKHFSKCVQKDEYCMVVTRACAMKLFSAMLQWMDYPMAKIPTFYVQPLLEQRIVKYFALKRLPPNASITHAREIFTEVDHRHALTCFKISK